MGLLIPSMGRGGAERVVSILADILKNDYEIILIVYQSDKMFYSVDVEVVDMNLPARDGIVHSAVNFIRRCKMLENIMDRYKLDAVISFLNSANLVNAFSRIGKSKVRKIISIRSYEYDITETKNVKGKIFDILYKHLERSMIRHVDRVVVVSKAIQSKMEQMYSQEKGKFVTIYNPYNIEKIKACAKEKIINWDDYFNSDDFIFVTVGRLEQPKGLWHLMNIFKYVVGENPQAKLLIVGAGSYREKIENYLKRNSFEKNVVMVGEQENPFKYLAKANVYVLTSTREGFPNALVEAMACGLPVIANDCLSGPREILGKITDYSYKIAGVQYMEYGLLTARLDAHEEWDESDLQPEEQNFADAMQALIEDDVLARHYARRAQEGAAQFSCEMCNMEYSKILS